MKTLDSVTAERDEALALLRAMVEFSPIIRYGGSDFACHFCGVEHHNRGLMHKPDCPWLRAKALVG